MTCFEYARNIVLNKQILFYEYKLKEFAPFDFLKIFTDDDIFLGKPIINL